MGGMPTRELDLVLFGATGYTGALTADYLARQAPEGVRWALAGRDPGRLAAVRDRLAMTVDTDLAALPLIEADAGDPGQLADLAGRTRVVASAAGPYLAVGEPLVAACAAAGTDYADLTGEPEFVDRMYVAHHRTACDTGARLVHACGFDSVPHDLGAYYTVQQLPSDRPITMRGVVRSSGTPSGGTLHSALTAMSRPRQLNEAAVTRRRLETRSRDRSSRHHRGTPHRDPVLGYWLVPLPTIDPVIVARSGRALPAYGPDFRYSHFAGTRTLRYAAGGVAVVGALAAAAQVKPLRDLLKRRIRAGAGPDESRRGRSRFTVDFVGEAGDRRVHTRVSGGDPYTESAAMLAESALCLALDDNPPTTGQVTTAEAMGDHLLARLQRTGLRFEVIDER